MPLISQVGRRSLKVRLLFLSMYLLLALGAASMVYPFWLMLAMSFSGRSDFHDMRLVPRYWVSEAALFRKYLLDLTPGDRPAWSANEQMPVGVNAAWFGYDRWFTVRDVHEEDLAAVMAIPTAQRQAMARDLRDFLDSRCPREFRYPCGVFDADAAISLRADYYAWLEARYGSLEAVNRAYHDTAATWAELGLVIENLHRQPGTTPRERDWREFLETRPPERAALIDADFAVSYFLRNDELPADYDGERDAAGNIIRARIRFDDLEAGKFGAARREAFLRSHAPARFITLDTERATPAWREFLRSKQQNPDLALPARLPEGGEIAGLWSQFLQRACPPEAIRLRRTDDYWRPFLRERYGTVERLNAAYGAAYASFEDVRMPWAAFRYDNFLREKGLRLRYLTHNFREVFAFIAKHGSALRVTAIYIALTLLAALTVNPLAAYAMSRFRLRESHHILIFLLATMTFPAEVLMIPNFLMIKNFPLAAVLLVVGAMVLFFVLTQTLGKRIPLALSATLALATLAVLLLKGLPWLERKMNLPLSVSLMNTFWALVLPGLANGYGIFLLKGFFDSLPPELYEAGLIDGAGELTMFWRITMPMSKPILAVIALGAFGSAYGAFMHAFLICQDPKMWTLMVFLYEFQQLHIVPMVMASLVVAALPTLLVFIVCQNIILRGIVIPTFK